MAGAIVAGSPADRTSRTPVPRVGACASGAYAAMGSASVTPWNFSFATTPTTVHVTPQNRICAPSGSRFSKNRAAAA